MLLIPCQPLESLSLYNRLEQCFSFFFVIEILLLSEKLRNINTNTHNYSAASLERSWVGGEKILAASARNKGFPGGLDSKVFV